jgi:hypothetical protein
VAEPDVTPLAAEAGWLGWTAAGLRVPRARRGGEGCLIRFCGVISGDVTVTGGSWPDVTAAMLCASAGEAKIPSDAAATDIRG